MKHNAIETVLGAVVLLIAAGFIIFAMQSTDLGKVEGYTVTANFSQATGITAGHDVRMSGVKIGSVTSMDLDEQTYLARVSMTIDPKIKLPIDTVAKISTEGLLGGKFLALEPGAEDIYLEDGEKIQYTQSAMNLEEMIGKFIFNASNGDNSSDDETSAQYKDGDNANFAGAY